MHPVCDNAGEIQLAGALNSFRNEFAVRRATAAALLRVLMEVDARRLYLAEGCASMFAWCSEVLHLCEGSAYNRIEVARAARKFPIILDLVEHAEVTLTAARLLAPHLTADNHGEVLASARYKSKREVEAIVAALQPKPDAPTVVRRVPMTTRATSAPDTTTRTPDRAAAAPSPPASAVAPMVSSVTTSTFVQQASPSPRALVQPLAPERYRIQVTVSRETHDRLRRAQSLLRHAVPTGDTAEILDRALVLLVEQLERRRFAETSRPKPPQPVAPRSRHIPAAVRRDVWKRDEGRCASADRHGRCAETAFLEFHHVEPYANGGAATIENIELRCRAHNAHEARLFFGT